jgi:hypothetical protein
MLALSFDNDSAVCCCKFCGVSVVSKRGKCMAYCHQHIQHLYDNALVHACVTAIANNRPASLSCHVMMMVLMCKSSFYVICLRDLAVGQIL